MSMKSQSASFDSTPEFQHFKDVMRKVIVVPKSELDEKMREYERQSKKARGVKDRSNKKQRP